MTVGVAAPLSETNGGWTPAPADDLTLSLDAARRAVEGRFLAAGEVLGQAVEDLSGLIASLDRLGLALDGQAIGATTGELQAAADELLALPERHAHRRGLLQRLADAGARLAREIEAMDRHLAYLRVFAVSIKVTAAGIPVANKEFAAFAQEICDCIEQGRSQLKAFEADLGALRATFAEALEQEQRLAGQCAEVLAKAPQGLTAATAELTAHHRRIGEVTSQVSTLAHAVRKKVAAALGALQIGDITRQRVEHVIEGLAALAAVCEPDPGRRGRLEAFVFALLADQLRHAADDFHREVARIAPAIAGIAGDAGEILRLRERAFGRGDRDDAGPLRLIEGHVGDAMAVVEAMAAADADAARTGGRACAAATGLGLQIGHLRAMETDVQHMALNTTLKCSRIGEAGRPLAVIAVELRTHAVHVETSTGQAMQALQGLSGDAGALGEAGEGEARDVGAMLTGSSLRLRQAADAVETGLAGFGRQGESVVEALRRACSQLDFEAEIGLVLDEAVAALAERAGPAPPAVADLEGPLAPLLAGLAKGYTMAQEREVHRRWTEGLSFAELAAETPKAAPADLDDVLF